jgi:amino acid transporter
MSMSRDGLLPKAFGKIHPKYKTPWFSTIITGLLVAIPTLFMESSLMTELTSIGTLFAFVLVSGGVILLPRMQGQGKRSFRLPYINGQWVVVILYLLFLYLFRQRLQDVLQHLGSVGLQEVLFLVYTFFACALAIFTFVRKYSLIPVLGVLFCAYLLIEIRAKAWEWFFGWMAIGLVIYFLYGYRKSRLKMS